MHSGIKKISAVIAASVTGIHASVFNAAAADTPDTPISKGIGIILLAVIFAVTLILSTVMTYRLRTRKLSQHTENKDASDKSRES